MLITRIIKERLGKAFFLFFIKACQTDITDDKGNILEKGIKDAEIDFYTKKI